MRDSILSKTIFCGFFLLAMLTFNPGNALSYQPLDGGDNHSLAVDFNGDVWAWGRNDVGQLGNNNLGTNSSVPVQTSPVLSNIIEVKAQQNSSLALASDGTVWAFGLGTTGQLGNGLNTTSAFPVQILPANLSGVITIGGGNNSGYAVKSDGSAWSWGDNGFGQLGDGSVAASSPDPVQVSGLTNVIAISGGGNFALALKSDGTVWSWGRNLNGQLGIGTFVGQSNIPVQVKDPTGASFLTGIIAIATGNSTSYALKNDGTVWAWGECFVGQLGNGTFVDSALPVQVVDAAGTGTLGGITDIAAGIASGYALTDTGIIWAWGFNKEGELGTGTIFGGPQNKPVQSGSDSDWCTIGAGHQTGFGSKIGGTPWAWGANDFGQLGINSTSYGEGNASQVNTISVNCPPPVPVNPLPPASFSGSESKNQFATQTDIIDNLFWTASPDSDVISYRIYLGGNVVAEVLASSPLKYSFHNRIKNQVYTYAIVSVDSLGNESAPLTVVLP